MAGNSFGCLALNRRSGEAITDLEGPESCVARIGGGPRQAKLLGFV
jgi:hypothetical protein